MKKNNAQKVDRCWKFFNCLEHDQKKCMMPELMEWRCWLLDVPCCKMDRDAPHPLSIKKNLCKNCEYFKEYGPRS